MTCAPSFCRGAAAVLSIAKEEARMALKKLRARSFAQFTMSEQSKILRCTQNDSERAQDDSIAAFFRGL